MAVLSNKPSTLVPGVTSDTITLSVSDLITFVGLDGDDYYNNPDNIRDVIFFYHDSSGKQRTNLTFMNEALTSTFHVSSHARQNSWECYRIKILDFDEGFVIVERGNFATANALDIVITSGDPSFANVKLLLHMNGSNNSTVFTDIKSHTITANGGAVISTAQSKFGGASGLFTSSGYLSIPTSSDFAFGTGDFTVEGWIRPSSLSSFTPIMSLGKGVDTSPQSLSAWYVLFFNGFGGFTGFQFGRYDGTSSTNVRFDTSLTTGQWCHIAFTRQSGTVRAFINGVQIGTDQTYTDALNPPNSDDMWIGRVGANGSQDNYFDGYMDDIRITKGIARYTTSFTAPTAQFQDS